MKKLLCLTLVALMLLSCACSVQPEEVNDDVAAEELTEVPMTNLAANETKELRVNPVEKGYIRGGNYAAMNWREINAATGKDTNTAEPFQLKEDGSATYTRRAYFTFDLTAIDKFAFKKVFFSPSFTSVDASKPLDFNLYSVDGSKWSTDTLTWNNAPAAGEVIGSGVAGALCVVDLTAAVDKALSKGQTELSFVMIITKGSGENNMNSKTCQLVATTGDSLGSFVYQLVEDEAKNKEIWDYAEKLFNEWFERYTELRKVEKFDAKLIVSDQDEFNKTVYTSGTGFGSNWSNANVNKPQPTRTYAALDDLGKYTDYKNYPYDVYGGWMNPSMKQEATGFFRSQKIDGRWWIIDPLGYPCFFMTISGPTINYLGSPNQKQAALDTYGTQEKWTIATVRWLKDELGFNVAKGLFSVENPTVTEVGIGGFAGGYGSKLGTNKGGGGSTTFTENNTMNVFDPGFVEYADEKAQSSLKDKVGNNLYTGFTTDNELPMGTDMLGNYLSVDYSNPINHYSYAAAWTWLSKMTGKDNPSGADIDDELSQLFRGFVYDRYFYVVDGAFEKYDSDHMNLGCRFLTAVKDAPWVLRFASLYLDAMTINWYGQWTPNENDIYKLEQNVDLPLMVTEFYTKAVENDGSFDDPDDPLKNTRGAGWVVRTQQDRGDFYQNFTLRLLETKSFVGWQWHQYLDDDDSPEVIYVGGKPDETGQNWRDQSNIDANKGIVNNWHEPYEELCDSMAEINLNAYRLALHFQAKYADK